MKKYLYIPKFLCGIQENNHFSYHISSSHQKQISPVPSLESVPVQAGTYDCGLFAVAFAMALALGRRPEKFQELLALIGC